MVYKPIKKAFNLQLRGHIQRWCGAGISSPPALCTRPCRLLVLIKVVTVYKQATKNPCVSGV